MRRLITLTDKLFLIINYLSFYYYLQAQVNPLSQFILIILPLFLINIKLGFLLHVYK